MVLLAILGEVAERLWTYVTQAKHIWVAPQKALGVQRHAESVGLEREANPPQSECVGIQTNFWKSHTCGLFACGCFAARSN